MGIGASISHHCMMLRLCQVSDTTLRDCGAQAILGFLIPWSAVNGRDRAQHQ
jgi:hypothetical protein